MSYLIAALIGAQIGIDIMVYWIAYKVGQHGDELEQLAPQSNEVIK